MTDTCRFELLLDPCLITPRGKYIKQILKECNISKNEVDIVTETTYNDLHYVCNKCRPDLFDSRGRLKNVKI